MKKLLFILLPLLLFLTCKEEPENPPEPLTLDQRLVGGRWYFVRWDGLIWHGTENPYIEIIPYYSEGYYEFTSDSRFICSKNTLFNRYYHVFSGKQVYSKDGRVYLLEDNIPIMQYEFPDSYTGDYYPSVGSIKTLASEIAARGDLINYRLISGGGGFLDDGRSASRWVLIRCTEYDDPNDDTSTLY